MLGRIEGGQDAQHRVRSQRNPASAEQHHEAARHRSRGVFIDDVDDHRDEHRQRNREQPGHAESCRGIDAPDETGSVRRPNEGRGQHGLTGAREQAVNAEPAQQRGEERHHDLSRSGDQRGQPADPDL